MAAAAVAPTTTAKEAMLFFSILMHQEGATKANWTAVARENGFASGKVAQTRFGQLKKKYGGRQTAAAAPAPRPVPAIVHNFPKKKDEKEMVIVKNGGSRKRKDDVGKEQGQFKKIKVEKRKYGEMGNGKWEAGRMMRMMESKGEINDLFK